MSIENESSPIALLSRQIGQVSASNGKSG